MNDKLIGAILLSVAAITGAIGVAGSQIACAVVLGQYYVAGLSEKGGPPPPPPYLAPLPSVVMLPATLLALLGLWFLFRKSR